MGRASNVRLKAPKKKTMRVNKQKSGVIVYCVINGEVKSEFAFAVRLMIIIFVFYQNRRGEYRQRLRSSG